MTLLGITARVRGALKAHLDQQGDRLRMQRELDESSDRTLADPASVEVTSPRS